MFDEVSILRFFEKNCTPINLIVNETDFPFKILDSFNGLTTYVLMQKGQRGTEHQ
jgi:hypothetical protein